MVLDMFGAVAGLAFALGAVAEEGFGRGVAVEFADEALVLDAFGSHLGLGLMLSSAVALFPVLEMLASEEEQVVEHRGDDHHAAHPIAFEQSVGVADPEEQGEPFDFDRKDKIEMDRVIGEHPGKR